MIEKDINFKKKLNYEKQKSRISECIWGEFQENSCKGKIVKAHSIQRRKILEKISDNGLIQTLELITENGKLVTSFESIGIAKFSTFTGFCQKHDKEIFQPIEDKIFNQELEQKYIYAYRAVTKEYHTKKESLHITDKRLTELNNNNNQEMIFPLQMKLIQDGMSLLEFKDISKFFQDNINKKVFLGMKNYYISFDQEYPIACSSTFIPYYDFIGNPLFTDEEKQQISLNANEPKDTKYLFVNIFPENGKTHILISHFKNQKKKYKFLSKLIKLDGKNLKINISNMIINYIENIAFSPIYINENFSQDEIKLLKETFIKSVINPNDFIDLKLNLFRDT